MEEKDLKEQSPYFKELSQLKDEVLTSMSKETDRALAVLSAIYLDNILERLIRTAYIKDKKIGQLFKNNQLLQSFYNKINIAYFSGLIPEVIYHDLKIICEIRNKFAHSIIGNTSFDNEIISEKINEFSQLPRNVIKLYPPKLKFNLIVVHIGALLMVDIEMLARVKPPTFVELLRLSSLDYPNMILTPEEIASINKRHKRKYNRKQK